MRVRTASRLAGLIVLILSSLVAPAATWAKDPVNTSLFGKKAIHGYDPVAYFADRKPLLGKEGLELEWMGARWRFTTAEHREAFRKTPEMYAPQYGGYCAYAVSQGRLVDIDPNAWSIVDGKLYLNYDSEIQKKWQMDIPGYVIKADKNWPGVLE